MDERVRSTFHQRAETRKTQTSGKRGEGSRQGMTGREVTPADVRRRLTGILRGMTYGGIAFLLSGCSLLFGTLPLGLALLCASSHYTWYILAGLTMGTLWGVFEGVNWVWISVYALAILLRLGVQFFVEPPDLTPTVEGTGAGGKGSMARQWAALKALLSGGHSRHAEAGTGATPAGVPSSATVTAPDSASTGFATAGTAFTATIDATVAQTEAPTAGRASIPNGHRQSTAFFSASPAGHGHTAGTAHRRLFNETPLLRIFTGAICGFAAGLCGILRGGFAFYDLFAALFLTVTVPAAVALIVPSFRRAGQTLLFAPSPGAWTATDRVAPHGRSGLMTAVSVGSLLLATVFAARDYVVYMGTPYITLRLAPLLALLLTLGLTARCGLSTGLAAAVVAGVGADAFLTPGLVLAALLYAALRVVSSRVGVAGGCVAVLLWCALLGGRADVWRHLFTCLVAIPLYLVLENLYGRLAPARPCRAAESEDFVEAAIRETREVEHNARIKALSEAFSSLSRLFYDMSDRWRRPRMSDMHRVCEAAVGEACAACDRRESCREAHRDLPDALAAHLSVYLRTHRTVSPGALPPALRAACPHTEAMIATVNTLSGELTERCVKGERTEALAADYEAMSAILAQAVTEMPPPSDPSTDVAADGGDYACDRTASDRIAAVLAEQGLTVDGVVVCGKRERHIVVRGEQLEGLADDRMATVKAAMEEICGGRLSEPAFDVRDGRTVMRLTAEPELEVSFAGSTVPAGTAAGETLPVPLTDETLPGGYVPPYTCGDHIALFTSNRAYFYALISDGMGSGEEASLTSDISTVFLERMLSAGNRPEIALSMLGNFLRQKNTGTGSECSATVDLMELDLFGGDAVFFKNGAAPTYVIRGGTVYKLRSRTMPLGILKNAPPDALRFRTHPGDVVVMVSDGVTHGNDECPWLIDLLSAPLPPSMDTLRLNILHHAIASGSPDDMSAIALRVEEK